MIFFNYSRYWIFTLLQKRVCARFFKVTGHSKESTQFVVYIFGKMARNPGTIHLIRLLSTIYLINNT